MEPWLLPWGYCCNHPLGMEYGVAGEETGGSLSHPHCPGVVSIKELSRHGAGMLWQRELGSTPFNL